ncbi:HWE histidine kinase domain-containing protein [Devosia sp.]|uniref:sensor histidine kinase n=1 Tax=Devosia sp. TaxID=1871048 RepID=UPI0032643370
MIESAKPLSDAVRQALADPSRLEVLEALEVIEGQPDPDFDRLTRIAARLFGAEFSLVTLLDQETQRFKSCFGIDALNGTSVDISFCAHTIAAVDRDHLIIPDMLADPQFADNPFVTGWPGARFYAGAPIVVHGQRLGTLCVLGTTPRAEVDPQLVAQLIDLADVASTLFSLKQEARVRARTSAALIREEWRHALTLEAGKVGSWVWDVKSGDVGCNDTFRRMHELPERGGIQIEQLVDAILPGDRAGMQAAFDAAFEGGIDFNVEVRARQSGNWLVMRGRVYQRDAYGNPLVVMGASFDITESKVSAEQTRLLLRELNHRVKNTLAMIQSVARQTIRQNPDPRDFIEAFSGRLRTISDAHVLLADRDWAGVHLYEVIGAQLGPNFITSPDRVEASGRDVFLPADHALGLGLILHELTTNAHKYGAWSDAAGIVAIDWDVVESPSHGLLLNWSERNGPAVQPPIDNGLGVRLIERSLAKVLDSSVQLNFAPDGVTARVWMPLPPTSVAL